MGLCGELVPHYFPAQGAASSVAGVQEEETALFPPWEALKVLRNAGCPGTAEPADSCVPRCSKSSCKSYGEATGKKSWCSVFPVQFQVGSFWLLHRKVIYYLNLKVYLASVPGNVYAEVHTSWKPLAGAWAWRFLTAVSFTSLILVLGLNHLPFSCRQGTSSSRCSAEALSCISLSYSFCCKSFIFPRNPFSSCLTWKLLWISIHNYSAFSTPT